MVKPGGNGLRGFLKRPNGIPSHDTFARVSRLINTEALEQSCHRWLRSVAERVQGVVAIDGKSVRGARDGKRHPLHIVSAWSSQNSMLLGQVRTADKSNEITAIPEPLKLLDIEPIFLSYPSPQAFSAGFGLGAQANIRPMM